MMMMMMKGLEIGTKMEHINSYCVTGFADVHFNVILDQLNGSLVSEAARPEQDENGGCQRGLEAGTRERMVDFISDFFTTEDYLTDSLSLIGPTATNILVTPQMQFYGGGVYYSPEECTDYALVSHHIT